MVARDAVRDVLQHDGLAGARRRHDEASLALPDRCHQVEDPSGRLLGAVLEHEVFVGVEGRQVVEEDLLARAVGLLVVDLRDAEQSEVALALLGWADLTGDDVAGPEVEALHLRRGDVDVVGPGQVVVVRRPQKPEAVGQDLEHALGKDGSGARRLRLEDAEDQFLLAHGRGALDVKLACHLGQFVDLLALHLLEVDRRDRRRERDLLLHLLVDRGQPLVPGRGLGGDLALLVADARLRRRLLARSLLRCGGFACCHGNPCWKGGPEQSEGCACVGRTG